MNDQIKKVSSSNGQVKMELDKTFPAGEQAGVQTRLVADEEVVVLVEITMKPEVYAFLTKFCDVAGIPLAELVEKEFYGALRGMLDAFKTTPYLRKEATRIEKVIE